MAQFPYFIETLRKDYSIFENKRAYPNAKDGDGVVITYNFMTSVSEDLRSDIIIDPGPSFKRYTAAEKRVIERALKAWSSVANITFVKSDAQDADLMFGQHRMPYRIDGYAGGLTYTFDRNKLKPADIWLDTDDFIRTPLGQITATHEVGHSLGLTHPFVGKKGFKPGELETSVMSQNLWGPSPYKGSGTKLGVLDTAAIQAIYGPAKKKLGDNTYKLGTTKLIWDGGGIDTISAAGAKAKAHIDMNDGSWNWIGKKAASILSAGQTWLGHFTEIENAVGSKFSDTIVGNELDNTIRGGKGNDTIIGGAGADTLYGGPGKDRFVFKSFSEMGTLDRPDAIIDFTPGDRIDLRGLGLKFLGNAGADSILTATKFAQFYFNSSLGELRFDSDGNGTADFAIRAVASRADQFLL
ncbi:M10 family metallopeptidase C-terminal domain-containing protein [Microvirga sp. 2MCAF38]|uniref:M10 family metallopeptidase C-terminal domain-containing protein n=1 Tax=Microvirga sp. 2MCAF38 TaxID=3232989 RepID=UPI003F95A3AE